MLKLIIALTVVLFSTKILTFWPWICYEAWIGGYKSWKTVCTFVSVCVLCMLKLFDVHKKCVCKLFLSLNYFPIRKLCALLHQNVFCSTRLACVCWICHIVVSAALNRIACTPIQLKFCINQDKCISCSKIFWGTY